MATANQLADKLKYDVERIPLPGEEKASAGALAVLEEIADDRPTVQRVRRYAQRDVDVRGVKVNDFLRTLAHADGRLALVTWSNAGMANVGYRPNDQRFDVGGYSGIRDMMGDDASYYETTTKAKAHDMLVSTSPDIVRRDEAGLLEPLTHAGGGE